MPERLRLGLIFGGQSVEHPVSVVSAQAVIAAADLARFEVVPIGITPEGDWLTPAETRRQLEIAEEPFQKRLTSLAKPAAWQGIAALEDVDVVFPLIHGTHGEDGTLQGLLELLGLPYVGCGVASSAIGMDKALMKAVFQSAGIAVGDHVVLSSVEAESDALAHALEIEQRIGYPAFVKPARGGSSLGISKVRSREELARALIEASKYDRKLVIEKMVAGREVECGVLGNRNAEASAVGEIRFKRDFYDYEAKYLDPDTEILAPADLPEDVVGRIQALAIQAFEAIDGAGLSRVDFFYCPDGSIVIDEINTMPGFTPLSMYPRLWGSMGVNYSELITRLVDLALAHLMEKRIA